MPKNKLSWLFMGAMLALCGALGALQYHWIGEVTVAARDRLRGTLQASLIRTAQDFNTELVAACGDMLPAAPSTDPRQLQQQVAAQYLEWKKSGRRAVFRRIAVAFPQARSVQLQMLDPDTAGFAPATWPPEWDAIAKHTESARNWMGGGPPPPPGDPGAQSGNEGTVFDFLIRSPQPGGPPFRKPQVAWVIFDLDPQYVRDVLLPEILQRHLATSSLDYQVEVVSKANPSAVIYRSDSAQARDLARNADAVVGLFDPGFAQIVWRGAHGGGPSPPHGPSPESGRWQMYVRHRAGSLEAVVLLARTRSLAVTFGVLLLMVLTVTALIRYTRRAQKLAQLQMDFVAGVSHELRTPLTTIYTAGYNLRGKVAANPAQVERYGALIQQESGRLKQLVEQILRFATANAGRVIQEKEPLSVESIINETVESTRPLIDQAHCVIEKNVDPGLPPILGDPLALRQVLENLISNAAKYGSDGANWIGIFATKTNGREPEAVEIRVADRGPGIPEDEQEQIFDPFFRGARAVQDQVHGSGLGLSLVKKIVEAHGGSIRVRSEPMKGAEFILRLPSAPAGAAQ
ncbi:MAG TPA: HAMP domain-containing sensor histidine kinase [Candidatus Sulfopaludibacter sp.]|nr:HAMP domain-containing sensor histidine kinase [Candidatus Sulfopaludibacter sp.]